MKKTKKQTAQSQQTLTQTNNVQESEKAPNEFSAKFCNTESIFIRNMIRMNMLAYGH